MGFILDDENLQSFELDGKKFFANGVILDSLSSRLMGRLSEAQYNILEHFNKNDGVVLSKEELKKIGWPGKNVEITGVVMAICHIRSLLSKNYITTIRGSGYVFFKNTNNYELISRFHVGVALLRN